MKPVSSVIANINIAIHEIINAESSVIVFPAVRGSKNTKAHVLWWTVTVALVIITGAGLCSGTTVVAVRGNDYVVLGSDSMIIVTTADRNVSLPGCKIQQMNKVFFGAAGVLGGPGFNAYEIARKASINGADTVAIANRFESAAREPFTAFVQRFRQDNPTAFYRYCNNRDCLQVAFASFDKGIPKLAIRSFRVTTKGESTNVVPDARMNCPGDCVTGAEQVVLGVNSEATSVFDRTPHFWKLRGIVPGMDELIGTEIAAHGDAVGPPVSILILDKAGARWMPRHQGLCQDPKDK
jgi:hypothetical protein